jgi:hypothetical protein
MVEQARPILHHLSVNCFLYENMTNVMVFIGRVDVYKGVKDILEGA